jgi:hypothetical protein
MKIQYENRENLRLPPTHIPSVNLSLIAMTTATKSLENNFRVC